MSLARTTVQPVTHGSPGITHITGAIPGPDSQDILHGTKRFAGATGRVRLSGAVDLSLSAEDVVTFDCLFVIDLD